MNSSSQQEEKQQSVLLGELIMRPSPIPLHQAVIMELAFQMLQFAKSEEK